MSRKMREGIIQEKKSKEQMNHQKKTATQSKKELTSRENAMIQMQNESFQTHEYSTSVRKPAMVSIYGCSLPVPFWDDIYQQVAQLKNPKYIELQEPITNEELPAKERVLSNIIELFLEHHQRELTLVLSNKLTSEFKQKWKDACAQTNVKIYFGIELHMAKIMKTYEENKRKMAEVLATGKEINEELRKYIGDRKLSPKHPTVKKVTDEISVIPGVRALLGKSGDQQQNT